MTTLMPDLFDDLLHPRIMFPQMLSHAAQYLRGCPTLAIMGVDALELLWREGAQGEFVVHGVVEELHGEVSGRNVAGRFGGMLTQARDVPCFGFQQVLHMFGQRPGIRREA